VRGTKGRRVEARKEGRKEEVSAASEGSETRYSLCADNTLNSWAEWGSSR
jgi:hypothetical protein